MKLTAILFILHSALVSASPVNIAAKRARSGNLLQASREGQPIQFGGTDCRGFFCPESNLPGAASGNGPVHPVDFFVKDFEKMDELPNYKTPKKGQCHPKCRWSCDNPHCNSVCQPRCKPPKCVTACKKINLSKCKRTCKDPQCVVYCPPQCEHGACPKCKTRCGESLCALNCGKSNCESTCSEPDCMWDCKVNPRCQKPICKMTCDTSVCSFGKEDVLPDDHEVPYMGQEVAWKGLGKIPAEHLAEFAPEIPGGALLPESPGLMGGSAPLPQGGLKSLSGDTGLTMTPTIINQQR